MTRPRSPSKHPCQSEDLYLAHLDPSLTLSPLHHVWFLAYPPSLPLAASPQEKFGQVQEVMQVSQVSWLVANNTAKFNGYVLAATRPNQAVWHQSSSGHCLVKLCMGK